MFGSAKGSFDSFQKVPILVSAGCIPLQKQELSDAREKLEEFFTLEERMRGVLGDPIVDAAISIIAIQVRQLRSIEEALEVNPLFTAPGTPSQAAVGRVVLDSETEQALVQVLMEIALADEVLFKAEEQTIRRFFEDKLGYDPSDLARVEKLMKLARETSLEEPELNSQLGRLSEIDREMVFSIALEVAYADDEIRESESDLLDHVQRELGISADRAFVLRGIHANLCQQRMDKRAQPSALYAVQAAVEFTDDSAVSSLPDRAASEHELADQILLALSHSDEALSIEEISETAGVDSQAVLGVLDQMPNTLVFQVGKSMWRTSAALCLRSEQSRGYQLLATHLLSRDLTLLNCTAREFAPLNRLCYCTPHQIDYALSQCPRLERMEPGVYRLASEQNDDRLEEQIFALLLNERKPVAARFAARLLEDVTVGQVLAKVDESSALIRYAYGCGTWIGLTIWGPEGYLEAARQNWTLLRRQMKEMKNQDFLAFYKAEEMDAIRSLANLIADKAVIKFLAAAVS